jgi:hypothetical protein
MIRALSAALLHVRAHLSAVLAPFGWQLVAADNPFQKLAALSANGDDGICEEQ